MSVVEHQTKARGMTVLSRIGVICGVCPRGIADISPRLVFRIRVHSPCGIGDDAGAHSVGKASLGVTVSDSLSSFGKILHR